MTSDIGRQRTQYRKGLVLGFTVAEAMLLILFALLLALGAILTQRDNQLARMKQQLVKVEEMLKEARAKEEVLAAMVQNKPTDEFIRELVRARDEAAAIARERSDLETREHELEEQSGLAKAVQDAPDKGKAIRDLAALGARLEDQVTKFSPGKSARDIYDLIPPAVAAADAARQAGYTPDEANARFRNAEKTAREEATYRGQIDYLRDQLAKVGKGGDFPACWITEGRKIEFLFDVTLLADGRLRVRDITPPTRALDRRDLRIADGLFGDPISTESFLKLTEPLLDYETARSCRFFVMISDMTEPTQKNIYKTLRSTVESRFYIVLKHAA